MRSKAGDGIGGVLRGASGNVSSVGPNEKPMKDSVSSQRIELEVMQCRRSTVAFFGRLEEGGKREEGGCGQRYFVDSSSDHKVVGFDIAGVLL